MTLLQVDRYEKWSVYRDMSDKPHDIKLAQNLNQQMIRNKLSLTKLARTVGLNKSTLHNYCNGVVPSNIDSLKKIADLFGMSIDELVYGKKQVEPGRFHIEGLPGLYDIRVKRVL
jgi:transcriptional regulator with XRE-family HTH domain